MLAYSIITACKLQACRELHLPWDYDAVLYRIIRCYTKAFAVIAVDKTDMLCVTQQLLVYRRSMPHRLR